MAVSKVAYFHEISVKIEEPADSGTFILIAGMTARTIERETEIQRNEAPDAADESLPLSIFKGIKSVDYRITGEGVYDKDANKILQAMIETSAARKIEIKYLDNPVSGDIDTLVAPALLSNWSNQAEHQGLYTAEMTFDLIGNPVKTLVV